MDSKGKVACIVLGIVLLTGVLLGAWAYLEAHGEQQYLVLDTTRAQFLGLEPGALGSTSALTFTAVSGRGGGEVTLMPLGVVGDWETLASPLLPYEIESPAAVAYVDPADPTRRRIYLIGGRNPNPPAYRLDTVYTCEVYDDGSLSEWTLQDAHLPRGLASAAAAISTQDADGQPITPTLYLVGGKFDGGTSESIYYAHIDPLTLDLTGWHTATSGLPQPRLGLSAMTNGGYLYTLGGSDGASVFSAAVYHFSIAETGEPFGRSVDLSLPGSSNDNPNAAYHQTVLLDGVSPSFPTDTLYVIGGYNSSNSTVRVLRADISEPDSPDPGYIHEWIDIIEDDLPEPLSAFAVALGDLQGGGRQVYVIGGTQGRDGNVPQNTIRSAAVDDAQNSFYRWYGGAWLTSPALPAVRYRHAAVQVGDFVYAIAGHGANDPAPEYYRDVLRGQLVGTGAWQYAPQGEFRSRVVDLGHKYRLTWLEWASTITPTDPGVTMTLQFRAGNKPDLSDAAGAWTDLLPSNRGQATSTLVLVPILPNFPYYPPVARYVQYRAFLQTTAAYSDVTPALHEVGVRVEDSPDLVVSNVQFSCDGCYGSLGIVSETIHVAVTVHNQGGNIPYGNNFYVAMFITNTSDYAPAPPDWPTNPAFRPGSTMWGMQGGDFPSGANRTVTTTIFFTQPQSLFLYVFADYNDTAPPPDYDVGESDPDNNLTVRNVILVDPHSAQETQTAWYWATQTALPPVSQWTSYLPTVYRNYGVRYVYLPLVIRRLQAPPLGGTPAATTPTPSPVMPSPSPSATPSASGLSVVTMPLYGYEQEGADPPACGQAGGTGAGRVPVYASKAGHGRSGTALRTSVQDATMSCP